MLSFIQELIKNNPLITTMYSGGIIAILVMHSRIILEFIWQHLINLISFNITNVSKALDFGMNECTDLDTFLQNQKHLIQRSYEITNTNKIKEGYGKTWYWIFNHIVIVNKEYKEEPASSSLTIYTTMRVFFANKKKFIKKMTSQMKNVSEIYENKITIKYDYNSIKRNKRPLSTIYTNNNIAADLLKDIKYFLSSQNEYINDNILYKRNYLLYGSPGTGKSSLILALASELNFKINVINLKSITDVNSLLYSIKDTKQTFYVFEDIDAMSNLVLERNESSDVFGVVRNNKDKLTLSDILNVLDGLYTSEGAICFFTTNHIEHLDDAFLRDGRMDYKVELSNLDNITANKMIYDKLGLDNLFKKCSINPATLQELIRQVKWKKITITDFEKMINNDK